MQSYGDYIIDKKLVVEGTTELQQQVTLRGGLTIKSGGTDKLVINNANGDLTASTGVFTYKAAVVEEGVTIISQATRRMLRFAASGTAGMAIIHETATAEGKLNFIKVNNVGAQTSSMGYIDNTGLFWWEGIINGAKVIGRSDIKFKENVTDFTDALDLVKQTQPRRYTWKGTGVKDFGFVAQELEQVLPEAVIGTEGQKGVNYQAMVQIAFGAIKELSAQVDALKAELDQLKAKPERKTKKTSGG